MWLQVCTVSHGRRLSRALRALQTWTSFTEALKCCEGKQTDVLLHDFLCVKTEMKLTFYYHSYLHRILQPESTRIDSFCISLLAFSAQMIQGRYSFLNWLTLEGLMQLMWLLHLLRWSLALHVVLLCWLPAAHQVTQGKTRVKMRNILESSKLGESTMWN